jgi:hypothetical protein
MIKQLKGLFGLMATFRQISDTLERPLKMIYELVGVGLPSWDPPPEVDPEVPDLEAVERVREVIDMGSVEERKAFDKVMGTWRRITTGAPREPVREEEPPRLPAGRPAPGPAGGKPAP